MCIDLYKTMYFERGMNHLADLHTLSILGMFWNDIGLKKEAFIRHCCHKQIYQDEKYLVGRYLEKNIWHSVLQCVFVLVQLCRSKWCHGKHRKKLKFKSQKTSSNKWCVCIRRTILLIQKLCASRFSIIGVITPKTPPLCMSLSVFIMNLSKQGFT